MDTILFKNGLIWSAYAITIGALALIVAFVVHVYQDRHDRAGFVTVVCVLALTSLLATVLLLPVDVAITASTNNHIHGIKYDWATPDRVEKLQHSLQVLYYGLYIVDILLCLVIVPFTYFWYDLFDDEDENGNPLSPLARLIKAAKQACIFVIFLAIIVAISLCAPLAGDIRDGEPIDFDYFKRLLKSTGWEPASSFILGLLMSIGTVLSASFLAPGMALMPLSLLRRAPTSSALTNNETNIARLEAERDSLHMMRDNSHPEFDSRAEHRLSQVIKDIRSLRRTQNLNNGFGRPTSWYSRAWVGLENLFRPIKFMIGFVLLGFSLLIWSSMLLTGIDKIKNSVCKAKCGYVLAHVNIFQPMNWLLVQSSHYFPADYVVFFALVLFLCVSLAVGIVKMNRGPTRPQSLLLLTGMMVMVAISINFTVSTMIAPQYSSFGSQTFCDRTPRIPGMNPDCSSHPESIKLCTEISKNGFAQVACTPSVANTIINRVTVRFPVFGALSFWGQFAILAVYLIVLLFTATERACWTGSASQHNIDELLSERAEVDSALSRLLQGRRSRYYGTVPR